MKSMIESVINISEGRNKEIIQKITKSVSKLKDTHILHIDQGESANRTVITLCAEASEIVDACFAIIKRSSELIDMSIHQGEHLRIGSTDVCPLIPIKNVSMEEVIKLSYELSEKVASELNIPVFNYDRSAKSKSRYKLENCRKGQYEGLEARLKKGEKPDYGEAIFNSKNGATIIGAREFLLAYNINLKTKDANLAQKIAEAIRESGSSKKGSTDMQSGILKCVKAVGWYIDEFGFCQVSTNITDYKTTSIFKVFETTRKEAKKLGIELNGSELIGLIPLDALSAFENNNSPESIEAAIEYLGLSTIKPFHAKKRILEYKLQSIESLL